MLGQSFAPLGGEDDLQQRQQAQGGGISPIQEAIKLLSLRIPRFMGQTPIPQPLLNSPGMAGLPSGVLQGTSQNPLQQALELIIKGGFGAGGTSGGTASGSGGTILPPKIIPGIDEGEPAPGTMYKPPTQPAPTPAAPQQPPYNPEDIWRGMTKGKPGYGGSYYPQSQF